MALERCKLWIWICPEKDCNAKGRKAMIKGKAGRLGRIHMRNIHGIRRGNIIVVKKEE